MTPELIIWLAGIAGAFYLNILVFNHFENKQIRKRRAENEELNRKVIESLMKDNELEVDATKIKTDTVDELKDEINEDELIHPPETEKVTVSAGNEVIYETERLVRTVDVGKDHEIVIPLDVKEPEWADAMRESAEQDSEDKKQLIVDKNGWRFEDGPHLIFDEMHDVHDENDKSQAELAREIAREKQGNKPFYKNENKKEWE